MTKAVIQNKLLSTFFGGISLSRQWISLVHVHCCLVWYMKNRSRCNQSSLGNESRRKGTPPCITNCRVSRSNVIHTSSILIQPLNRPHTVGQTTLCRSNRLCRLHILKCQRESTTTSRWYHPCFCFNNTPQILGKVWILTSLILETYILEFDQKLIDQIKISRKRHSCHILPSRCKPSLSIIHKYLTTRRNIPIRHHALIMKSRKASHTIIFSLQPSMTILRLTLMSINECKVTIGHTTRSNHQCTTAHHVSFHGHLVSLPGVFAP
mmetsp:Transcript_26757/g.41450  ORF Transcript_26757/g.41450 Transcript_26757/m.41450 type:complete len:266 (+) Transcript_26757:868-1665(+)